MLKQVPVSQVRLGMFIHQLQGTSWINHPFWKTSFVLTDPADLQRLQLSAVTHVVIDVSQGEDVQAPAPQVEQPPMTTAPERPRASSARSLVRFEAELAQAAALKQRAKEEMVSLFEEARLGKAVTPEQVGPLVDDISSSVLRNPDAFVSLARLRNKDDYTFLHSVTVCALMVSLGRHLGMADAQLRDAGMAGLLHDVGKAMIPLEVLNKPGRLTDEEFDVVKGHARHGFELLVDDHTPTAKWARDVALHHHERFDGKGYPDGLAGEQISLLARMGAVCDVYDAITSNRPYKSGWDAGDSIRLMARWAKEGQFDMSVFQAFVKTVGIYPTGTLVQLQSGYLGVVLEQAHGSTLKPRVRVIMRVAGKRFVTPHVVDLADPHTSDKIVSKELPENWGIGDLSMWWAGTSHVADAS